MGCLTELSGCPSNHAGCHFVCVFTKKKTVIDYLRDSSLLPFQKLVQLLLSWQRCLPQVAQMYVLSEL